MQDYLMRSSVIWHRLAIFVGIISLLVVTYSTILLNNFRTPETTAHFLSASNTFSYMAEIIKANIRNRYPPQLKTNPIKLALAETLLTRIVTTDLIERIALPALQARKKLAELPTAFAGNNLVLNTQQYTSQLSATIASFQLPPTLQDAANNLIASVPPQITLVNATENPNSVLVGITRTRIFFENIQTIQRIFGILLMLAVVTLVLCNVTFLKRLISGLMWFLGVSGLFLLLISLILPSLADALSQNPDPVAGVLRDGMITNIVSYYLSLTRNLSFILLLIALGLYFVYRYVPLAVVETWVNTHLSPVPIQQRSTKRTSKK